MGGWRRKSVCLFYLCDVFRRLKLNKVIMKKIFILASLVAVFTSCSKYEAGDRKGDSIVDEWIPIKIVRAGVDTSIDDCNRQTKVTITTRHFTYYKYWKDNQECKSFVDDYDYVTSSDGGRNIIRNSGGSSSYYYALEDEGAHLRISNYLGNTYVILKRK